MTPIMQFAERHGLAVIEDAHSRSARATTTATAAASAPSALLGASPEKSQRGGDDGGFLATNDKSLAEQVKLYRNHGLVDRNTVAVWGTVSRMDVLQAGLLSMRLRRLPEIIERRRRNAERYRQLLDGAPVFIPPCRNHEFNTFHVFVVQTDRRDELQADLARSGIGTAIHYPIPIHLQPAAAELGHKRGDFPVTERQAQRILSLPIHQYLTVADQVYVANAIKSFSSARRRS